MKKLFISIAAIAITASVWAQSPEKMSYQAVIRDANNTLVTNHPVGMQISILQGSVSGSSMYTETQTPVSNENGLVTIEIGGGTVVSGNFSTINWGNGVYFIKTETDPVGATNYTITGTSQLLSVPYAMYAKKAGMSYRMLHRGNLGLVMGSTTGPNVVGSSTDIGDINKYSGLLLEWKMNGRPEVFQQLILLSDYDKQIILGTIATPEDYPRRYTTILADNFGTLMWLGVSIEGTRLYLSTNSVASPRLTLERIYGIE
jgi:hypothetical protein